jgi:hypothetical protein
MRLRPNRLTKAIACAIVGGIGLTVLLGMLKRHDRDVQIAFVKKGAEFVAACSADFHGQEHRLPKDLMEVHNYIHMDTEGKLPRTGGLQFLFDAYDPEFYIDPRSNAKEACVWLRARKQADPVWVMGCTEGWSLPSAPPPD